MNNNNEEITTMTRPPKDMVNFMILQRIDSLVNIMEILEMKDANNRDRGLPELKSTALSLILLIKKPLERQLEKDQGKKIKSKTIQELRKSIYDATYENKTDLYKIIDYILDFAYDKDILKWDTKEGHDRKDIWASKQRYLGGKG